MCLFHSALSNFVLNFLKKINSSVLATPLETSSKEKLEKVGLGEKNVTALEKWIDEYDAHLPQLTTFILPSGGEAACQIHICRTVCRRAERCICELDPKNVPPTVFQFVNRLSDFLFISARICASEAKEKEIPWKKEKE